MRSSPLRARVLLIVLGAILSACSNGPSEPSELPVGRFDGQWDGAAWRGQAYAVLQQDTLWIIAHRSDPEFYYEEYIRARVPFSGRGTYSVAEPAGQLAKIIGGDAGYFPDAAGTLTIGRYDAQTGTMAGELRLHTEFDGSSWHASGRFHAPVYPSFQAVPRSSRQ